MNYSEFKTSILPKEVVKDQIEEFTGEDLLTYFTPNQIKHMDAENLMEIICDIKEWDINLCSNPTTVANILTMSPKLIFKRKIQ